jgi:hypothetical protein
MFAGHVIVGAAGFGAGSFGLLHADTMSAAAMTLQCVTVFKFRR